MNGVSLLWGNRLQIGIVGNPENRRVRDFKIEALRFGFPEPACLSWLDLIKDPEAIQRLGAHCDLIRIDSAGENAEVRHQLIRLGGGESVLEFGEIGFLRESFLGLRQTLVNLGNVTTQFMIPPQDILAMSDKWRSHELFAAQEIPRPMTEMAPPNLEEFRVFRNRFTAPGKPSSGRVFLKPRYGSSASGVCAYRWAGDREMIIAPIEIHREGDRAKLFNSLRIRHFTSPSDIDLILSKLLPLEMICERWIPKAKLPGGRFDLRILVVHQQARHMVVRQSDHPMTNLHLGNQRGSCAEVAASFGELAIEQCKELAERASACFPKSLYAGVDVILSSTRTPYICEINAFGDLLPNLYDRGESAYESIINQSRRFLAGGHAVDAQA